MDVLLFEPTPPVILATRILTDAEPKHYWPGCEHGDGELRVHVLSNGTKQYKFQCQVCGRKSSAIPRAWWRIQALTIDPPMADADLENVWYEKRRAQREDEFAERQRAKDQENAEWWARYNRYLGSPKWQSKSRRTLKRDNWACRAELDGCTGNATQAHHLTYDHVFNEPLFDLISVCVSCHEQLTSMDRERRAA